VLELCRYLRGTPSKLRCFAGDEKKLGRIKYVITLDSDTRLCAGTAKELVGAAMHPLNAPEIDPSKGIVTAGSGIIQPRISVDLSAANQTLYTRIFAGQGGIDPYGGMTGDIYQNLFGTGSFAGKGLLDVDAYLACLGERIPENTVLSHDLLEGAYLRCAFASDIELTTAIPPRSRRITTGMHR
jgi:cyclic beta-1,2-glucan synthetase